MDEATKTKILIELYRYAAANYKAATESGADVVDVRNNSVDIHIYSAIAGDTLVEFARLIEGMK